MSVILRALLIAAVFLALPASASARIVQCGEVITSDTRVDNDLACATPVALQIGADGVDLDLRGHTIEAVTFLDEDGVYNEEGSGLIIPGYDDVSVTNGTVIGNQSLGHGVLATDAERLSLRRLSISGYASLRMFGDGARIVEVTTRGSATRIVSNGATIDGLTTTTELDVIGRAVAVTDGDFRNSASFAVDDSSLRRNVFDEFNGFWLGGNGNSVVNNQGGAWKLRGEGNSVRRNRIPRGLLLVSGSSGNLITDNSVGGGTGLFYLVDSIFVAAGAANNVLVANSASGSGDDGIDVEEPSTTLTNNRAFGNADLGIEAVPGAIDGGGNRAWNNGNPLQCLNVDCG
jgi:parallel beta-helix repeat protein